MDLQRVVAGLEGVFVARDLAHIGIEADILARIRPRRRGVNKLAQHLGLHPGVDQRELHALARGQFLAERFALIGVFPRKLQTAFGDADAARGMADASRGNPGLAEFETIPFLADDVGRGNPHIGEGELPRPVIHHGFLRPHQLDARRVHLHQEHGNAAA